MLAWNVQAMCLMMNAQDEHGLTPVQRLCALYSKWTENGEQSPNNASLRAHLARQIRLAVQLVSNKHVDGAALLNTPSSKEAGGGTAIHLALTPHELDNNTVPLLHALLPYAGNAECATVEDARGRTPLMHAIEMKYADGALALMKVTTGKVDKCVTVTKERKGVCALVCERV